MNPKYGFALVLALQVSVGLAQFPEPDKEPLEKFQNLKKGLDRRLKSAYNKVQHNVYSAVDWLTYGQANVIRVNFRKNLESYIEKLQLGHVVFVTAFVVGGLSYDATRLVEKASTAGLGLCGHYLRPYVATYMDEAIYNFMTVLDTYLPVE